MTDEAREAFTIGPMGWGEKLEAVPRSTGVVAYKDANGVVRMTGKAWLYDARIALEGLGYKIERRKVGWAWFGPIDKHQRSHGNYSCDAAIEAAVQHWWEEQQ